MSLIQPLADAPKETLPPRLKLVRNDKEIGGEGVPTTDPRYVLAVACKTSVHAALAASGREVIIATSGLDGDAKLRSTYLDELVVNYHLMDIRGDVLYTLAIARQPHLRNRAIFLVRDLSSVATEALRSLACPVLDVDSEPGEIVKTLTELG